MPQVHGLDVLSVYDPATGAVVQLNQLGDDTELVVRGALDGDGVTSPLGQPYFGGDFSRVSVTFLDTGAGEYDTLRAWQVAGRLVRFAGAGPAGALLWQEDTLFRVAPETVKGAAGGARGYRLTAERRGHASHRIWLDEDLLAGPVGPLYRTGNGLVGLGWETVSCAWNASDGMSQGVNFIDDTGTAGAVVRPVQRVEFPVSGVRLTASVAQAQGASGAFMAFDAQPYGGGAALTSGATPLTAATTPARLSGSMITPAGTWSVSVAPLQAAAALPATVWLYRPALRIGTSTAPGALSV